MPRTSPTMLSPFLASCPEPGVSTRPVTPKVRSAERMGNKDRARYRMAWDGMCCSLCGLPGSWTLPARDSARMTFGHTVPMTMYGSTNISNLTPQHAACNGAAGTRDLRGMVEYRVTTLPSLADALAWSAAGGNSEPEYLPSVRDMESARRFKGLNF